MSDDKDIRLAALEATVGNIEVGADEMWHLIAGILVSKIKTQLSIKLLLEIRWIHVFVPSVPGVFHASRIRHARGWICRPEEHTEHSFQESV